MQYMLTKICLIYANRDLLKVQSQKCQLLVRLHYKAVDFAKTLSLHVLGIMSHIT
jgi:hypothetical protein